MADQPYGPGAICEDCGHFAARHDEDGCHGVDPAVGCRWGKGGTKTSPKKCTAMLWKGTRWARPWDPNGIAGAPHHQPSERETR